MRFGFVADGCSAFKIYADAVASWTTLSLFVFPKITLMLYLATLHPRLSDFF